MVPSDLGSFSMKLQKILKDSVIYTTKGRIVKEQLTDGAKMVLDWYKKNIPVNQK